MLVGRIIRHSKETSKALVVVLAAALLGTGFAVMETASPANASACSTTATSFGGGDGTSVAPFQISSKEHLVLLSTSTDVWRANYHYIQTADIDLGGCEWASIGSMASPFTGTYDGGGKAISGLSINRTASSSDPVGLFGGTNGVIKNLIVRGAITSNNGYVGGLVGRTTGTATRISNVRVEVNINFGGANYAGGIVGELGLFNQVNYSSYSGTISSTNSSASLGGISGNGSGPIAHSYVRATISTGTTSRAGIHGWGTPNVTLSYSVPVGATFGISTLGVGASSAGVFWDTSVSTTNAVSSGGTTGTSGKTTSEMKSATTFRNASWSIVEGWAPFTLISTTRIWGICEQVNDGYPFLLWEYTTDPCTVAPPPSNSGSGSSSGSVVVAPIVVPEAVVAPRTVRQPTIRQATQDRPARLLGKSLNKDVSFVADSARLSPEARKSLRQAARLAMASDGKLAVTGFAAMTNRGSAYEKSVAQKRARAVARFLRAQGFDDWIYYHGLSGRQGQAFEGNPRRVEIRILN